ncbi:MAG: hypothetical protein Q8R08_00985 [bacterium]|nr:hypothetical protein [bacterium]
MPINKPFRPEPGEPGLAGQDLSTDDNFEKPSQDLEGTLPVADDSDQIFSGASSGEELAREALSTIPVTNINPASERPLQNPGSRDEAARVLAHSAQQLRPQALEEKLTQAAGLEN